MTQPPRSGNNCECASVSGAFAAPLELGTHSLPRTRGASAITAASGSAKTSVSVPPAEVCSAACSRGSQSASRHSLTPPSAPPVASEPPAAAQRQMPRPRWPWMAARCVPSSRHSRAVLSSATVASMSPSKNTASHTRPVWPNSDEAGCSCCGVSQEVQAWRVSHSRALRSSDTEHSSVPASCQARRWMAPSWPRRIAVGCTTSLALAGGAGRHRSTWLKMAPDAALREI